MPPTPSHPARGAWIEILHTVNLISAVSSRTPHGVRGLKFVVANLLSGGGIVAPRTGCVD